MNNYFSQEKKLTVMHSVCHWLPLTETWLYNQNKFLPPEVENHVVCEERENLARPVFYRNIPLLKEIPLWRYFVDKGLRKLRIRCHLGFLVDQAKRHKAQILTLSL